MTLVKVGGPRQGKELVLVPSEKTPSPSCLPGHFYLFSKDASTGHLLSADVTSHGPGEMEQAAVYCWPRQGCL